ncbi:MAG TPA: hypothetical protein VGP50_00420 [Stellaceae bacterium]|nr:hypothetical protein [Stellaceae bacterium]
MRKMKSPMRNILGLAGIGLALAAQPAPAQILGDADCPGGYSYNRAYGICVPYGSTYVPNYYDYGNPYPPPFYGYGPYVVVTPPDRRRNPDRDRDRDRR